jgi:hypothetical protein
MRGPILLGTGLRFVKWTGTHVVVAYRKQGDGGGYHLPCLDMQPIEQSVSNT